MFNRNRKLAKKAKLVKLIGMDVDGVLTAGEIIILNDGEELKIWNVKDRLGFHLVRQVEGIKFAWISGRASLEVTARAKELGIEALYQGCKDKSGVYEEILKNFNLKPEETAFIGDDLIDIPILQRVGLAVCPQDAPAEVKKEVDYIAAVSGGKGVLREVVELILKSQGIWDKATAEYYS